MADYKHHVFLSYSRKDSEIMNRIRTTLRLSYSLKVWVDEEELEPGTPSWRVAIQNAIEEAGCVVTLFSPDAKTSEWVGQELDYAKAHGKRVFPLLVAGDEKTAVPFGYATAQWIDLRERNDLQQEDTFSTAIQRLANTIAMYLRIEVEVLKAQEPNKLIQALRTVKVREVMETELLWISSDASVGQAFLSYHARKKNFRFIFVKNYSEGINKFMGVVSVGVVLPLVQLGILKNAEVYEKTYWEDFYSTPITYVMRKADRIKKISADLILADALKYIQIENTTIGLPVVDQDESIIGLLDPISIVKFIYTKSINS